MQAHNRYQQLSARLDRLPMTRFAWRVGFLLGLAYIVESLDIGSIGVVIPPLKALWHLSPGAVGLLAIASTAGIILGLIPTGYLADRYGRKTLLFWGVVEYSVLTILAGFSPNLGFLLVVRFLAGLGMGAVFPLPYAALNEFVDRRHRAAVFGFVGSSLSIGYFAAPLLGLALMPHLPPTLAWRVFFVAAGVPLAYAFVVRRYLPESPRWLAAQGRWDEAERTVAAMEGLARRQGPLPDPAPLGTLKDGGSPAAGPGIGKVWRPPHLRNTLVGIAGMTAALTLFYIITTYMPTILVKQGFSYAHSLAYTAIISGAAIPGELANGWLSERWGRKPTFVAFMVPAAVGSVLFGAAHGFAGLVGYGCAMSFFGTGTFSGLKVFYSEQFPTALRATGSSTVESLSRLMGGVAVPFVIPLALVGLGLAGTFRAAGAVALLGAAMVAIWGRETRGKSLAELEAAPSAGVVALESTPDVL